jgi:malate dehydrogenase (oxaloacetate-decarboxylating)(NADP+)
VVDEKLARPVLVGRPNVLEQRIEKFGLRLKQGVHFDVINPDHEDRYRDYWQTYYEMTMRKGVTQDYAKLEMRRRHSLIGAMMIHKGDADGMICGTFGTTSLHLHYIDQVLGRRAGANVYAAMNFLILPERQLALVDTHVNENPTAEQLAEITILAAEEMTRFGLIPRAALLSHSNWGSANSESARKMRAALAIVQQRAPGLEVDGEMHGDVALDSKLRKTAMPHSTLQGDANLLVLPNLDTANIAYNLLKTAAGNGIAIGPVLLGCAKPVHILTPSATVRRIVNMTALCVVDAVAER